MRVAVIIPVLNEEAGIAATLRAVQRLEPDELIVVDGGSDDRTWQMCRSTGVVVVAAPRGRGSQMNRGAADATADILVFLHADTRLPQTAFDDIRAAMGDFSCVGGRFDMELDADKPILKIVGAMINLRSRLSKVGTGDQAIFIRREIFKRLGGFPEIPMMEDIALSRAMKRAGSSGLPAEPGGNLGAALGNRRRMAHDFKNVDTQVALLARGLAVTVETFL